jgi:hypothetical protein
MALSYPLSLAQFFHGLRLLDMSFDLDEAMTYSETGGGELLRARRGVQLWSGQIRLAPGPLVAAEAMRAKIDVLRRPGASFLIGHPVMRRPQADPTGSLFGGATLSVHARVNAREISIAGGVSGAQLSAGDHMSIALPGGRFAYFRIVVGAAFSALGRATVEVSPDLPASVGVGNPVTVILPHLKAVIRPGSHAGPVLRPSRVAGEQSFSWVQTLG